MTCCRIAPNRLGTLVIIRDSLDYPLGRGVEMAGRFAVPYGVPKLTIHVTWRALA
jgi:hypothetical protein